MVDGSKSVAEVNVCKVNIFGGESSVFEGGNNLLDLSGCVSLRSKVLYDVVLRSW